MKRTRREWAYSLPALFAVPSSAQASLPSRAYKFEDLPVRTTGPDGRNRSRAVLDGKTRSGYAIEMHETELAPGLAPHPPHKHVHEELMMIREGTLEVTVSGRTTTLGPGSAVYIATNEEHGWRNAGSTTVHYFVMTLGRETLA